jgi:hypothetical protein
VSSPDYVIHTTLSTGLPNYSLVMPHNQSRHLHRRSIWNTTPTIHHPEKITGAFSIAGLKNSCGTLVSLASYSCGTILPSCYVILMACTTTGERPAQRDALLPFPRTRSRTVPDVENNHLAVHDLIHTPCSARLDDLPLLFADVVVRTPTFHLADESRDLLLVVRRPRQHAAAKRQYFAGNAIGGYPFVGTPDEVAQQLAGLSTAGLRGIAVSFIDYLGELPYFCDEVLPRLARLGVRHG